MPINNQTLFAMKNHYPKEKMRLLNNSALIRKNRKKLFRTLFGLALCICCQLLNAQQKTVTGKITDSVGNPVAGASVIVKGTKTGISTNNNGNFSIKADENATIVVTTAGFETQQKSVAGVQNVNFSLKASNVSLESVVVIGYQTVRKRDLTGSVGVVDMTDAAKITSGSVGEAIQGLVPGVTVRNGGAPGSGASIEIRGVGSFTNSAPLYVIDGMLADANTTVNPDDVASIQILKDASAAAIYGSRAGNGVIIITTKRGKDGPAKFAFSAKYGSQMIPKKWNVMDAPSYLKTIQTEYLNSNIALPTGIAAQVAANTINTNWQDVVERTGNDQDYNMNISGGTKTSSYLIAGNYYKNQGVLIGNDFQRASMRINTETHKGIFSIGENMMISNTSGNNPGGGINAFYETSNMLPIIAVQGDQYKTIPSNPAGWGMGTTQVPSYASNYIAVSNLDKIHYNYAKVVGNAYAELKFTNWLTYRLNAGVEVSFDYNKEERDTGIWRYNNQPPLTSVNEYRSTFTNFLLENTLNANKTFGLHNISAVVGFTRTQQERQSTSAGRSLLQTVGGQTFTTISSALGVPTASGGTPIFWRQHGYLGRINYAYNDKYLVSLTGRIDQDTRFGPQNRTGYFPSVAAAWRISKEKFFNVDWISDLKLRGSYGRLGISSSLDAYTSFPYLSVLNNSPRAIYGTGQTPMIGQYQSQLTDPNIHWETRSESNIGFDATLFHNKVTLTADVYNALSKDVLVSLPAALYLGVSAGAVTNAASIRNKGIEVALTYHHNDGPFKWDISGNMTTIDNKVVAVGNQGVDASGNKVDYLEPTNFIRAQVGHSIGEWYVIKTAGIFQSQQEIDNYVNKAGQKIQANAKPGDVKYMDANGDGTINNSDRQYAGSPWPTLQAGLQFNASYKNFSIGIQFIGVFGNKIYDDVRRVLDSYDNSNFRKDINPWSTTNTGATDPRLAVNAPGTDPTVAINNYAQTSRWLENGSYVRLRNLEIGYAIPNSTFGNMGISNARVYVSGQNLFTITKYKGLDPDVQGGGILERGFDNGNWPPSRVISAGIQLSF